MEAWVLVLYVLGSGKAIAPIAMADRPACVAAMEQRPLPAFCLNRQTGEVVMRSK